VLIILIVALSIIGYFLPLEFTNERVPDSFEQFRFYALPLLLLLTLFGTLRKKDTQGTNTLKVVTTSIAALFCFLLLFFSAFAGMCRWTTSKTLFYNRKDQTTRIVLREFGCGATDSGKPTYKVSKVITITPGLLLITDIDTARVDRNIWVR
jgi:hypothetical protein